MKTLLRSSAALLTASLAFAHDAATHAWKPTPYAEKLAHAATPLPDRVVLTWSGDPATTQAVTWRTATSVERGLAQLALAADNSKLKAIDHPARTASLPRGLSRCTPRRLHASCRRSDQPGQPRRRVGRVVRRAGLGQRHHPRLPFSRQPRALQRRRQPGLRPPLDQARRHRH
jgi:hypothetical protein